MAYQVIRIESIVSITLSYHIKMNSYPQTNTHKNVSYPQVYPQIDLTDYIIRQGRSGVMWRIVENGALLKRRS